MAGTRAAAADPRVSYTFFQPLISSFADEMKLQKQAGIDPNIGLISRDSMLSAAELEEEAILLRNQLVSQLFTQT